MSEANHPTPDERSPFPPANFNRLKPEETEALALLAEECGELIQAIGKILRHGLWSEHPESGIPNQITLEHEAGDVLAALRICEVQRLLGWAGVVRARDQKMIRVQRYLHHAKVDTDD